MPRRASLPGADLLFGSPADAGSATRLGDVPPAPAPRSSQPARRPAPRPPRSAAQPAPTRSSGSGPRHEEKITVYCTESDLTRLEAARLDLRANHGLTFDRGRIVRTAITEVLDDLDARGAESALVRRLRAE